MEPGGARGLLREEWYLRQ